jgi:hypothetical protein
MSAQPLTTISPRPYRDIAFISVLLALAAVPLILLRNQPALESPLFLPAFGISVAAILAVWLLGDRRSSSISEDAPSSLHCCLRFAVIIAAVVALFYIVYYMLMREHFWGGYDEVLCLDPQLQAVWSPAWDKLSRPTWGLAPLIGSRLAPDRIDGFLWAAGGVYLLNGLLLSAIMRRVMPGEPAIAAAAGVLLLCHRGDLSRFFVMWTGIWYWTSLCLLLLGGWLFLRSAHSGNRLGLVAACSAMGAAVLGSEAGFTLAAFAPILLYLSGVRGSRLVVWSTSWIGTIALLSVRFLQYFLTTRDSYQAKQTSGVFKNSELLSQNLSIQTEPFWRWFSSFASMGTYWKAAAAAATLAALALLVAGPATNGRGARRYLIGGLLAAAIAAAGLAPFIALNGPFRTQFYTAPGQAAMIAILAGGLFRLLGNRAGLVGLAIGVAVLAGAAASGNRKFQATIDKSVNFTKTVHIMRQIHAACPEPAPGALILLIPDDGVASPLGASYSFIRLTGRQFGPIMVHDQHQAVIGVRIEFLPDRVKLLQVPGGLWTGELEYPYDKLILFHVNSDGTVSLLRKLPDELGVESPESRQYDPLPLLRPGPIGELQYLRYPGWMKPPEDVVAVEDGVTFGAGWSTMQREGGRFFRIAEAGAELLVNSEGQSTRTLELEVEPIGLAGEAPYALELRDRDHRVLTQAIAHGRERLSLTIPTDPARAEVVSLWARPEGKPQSPEASLDLRIYAPTGAVRPPSSDLKLEITFGGLRLGENWYPLERWKGETFRWMNTGAELIVQRSGARSLVLDLVGGPGLGGSANKLVLVGPQGQTLNEATIADGERSQIRWDLPANLPAGASLKFEVIGGGKPFPGDPRICNVRIYRCELKR